MTLTESEDLRDQQAPLALTLSVGLRCRLR